MRISERVSRIMAQNLADHYIPLMVTGKGVCIYPMYFAQTVGEESIAFPVTEATGINEAIGESAQAYITMADREGYEAYVLYGKVRRVTCDEDYDLIAEMRNLAVGFPISNAVIFDVEAIHLVPPP